MMKTTLKNANQTSATNFWMNTMTELMLTVEAITSHPLRQKRRKTQSKKSQLVKIMMVYHVHCLSFKMTLLVICNAAKVFTHQATTGKASARLLRG